ILALHVMNSKQKSSLYLQRNLTIAAVPKTLKISHNIHYSYSTMIMYNILFNSIFLNYFIKIFRPGLNFPYLVS
ncbi:hypothetical protein L9F63_002057, partial [Diploptera punctata]